MWPVCYTILPLPSFSLLNTVPHKLNLIELPSHEYFSLRSGTILHIAHNPTQTSLCHAASTLLFLPSKQYHDTSHFIYTPLHTYPTPLPANTNKLAMPTICKTPDSFSATALNYSICLRACSSSTKRVLTHDSPRLSLFD